MIAFATGVIVTGPAAVHGSPALIAALVSLSACGYVVSQTVWSRVSALLDVTLALALVALTVSGPAAALAVLVAPDVLRLAHRRRAFLNTGLLANLVSHLAVILAGSAVLGLSAAGSAALTRGLPLLGAGAAMAIVNYTFARLLFAWIVQCERPGSLVRREFVPLVPLELVVILAGVICALTIPVLGVPALLMFGGAAFVPQLSAAALLSAPSVARLSVDAAAGVYRAALGDELALSRSERQAIEHTAGLVQCGTVRGTIRHLPGVLSDAAIVNTCLRSRPSQPAWSAPVSAQVVLVARAWAQLTARETPALSHAEALRELLGSDLRSDAPDGLSAAAQIIDRERGLTDAIAGVPRLHRLPLPRRARRELVPRALTHLAG